jgi:hypothetical protein
MRLILWDMTGLGLLKSIGQHINARLNRGKMQEYGHIMLNRVQTCPYAPEPKKFGTKEVQAPLPPDNSPKLVAKEIKRIQQIMRSMLYHAHAVDMAVLKALNSIAVERMKTTEQTMARFTKLLDCLSYNADAKI